MPEISVIMAVYNLPDRQILGQCINSILNQTYSDFEFVICDDGSTDNTLQILNEFAEHDSRIRVIANKENRKAGYARNTCIKVARGKYIAVVDADDIYPSNRLELQKEYLDKEKDVAFVGSRGEFFVNQVGDDDENYWYVEKPEPKDFLFCLPFAHASCMFRREVIESVNGYSELKREYRVEDYDMFLRIYAKGYRGINLQETLYYIRRDDNQYKRRKYRFRINEARMKYRGFKQLGLLPKGIIYVVKPLIVGLIPWRISAILQKVYYRNK